LTAEPLLILLRRSRDRVSTRGSPHVLRRGDGGRSDSSDQARSDRRV